MVGLPPRPGSGRLPLVEGAPPLGGGGAGGVWLGVPALGAGAKADLYLPLLHGGALPGGGAVRGVLPAVRERPLCPAAHLPRGIGVPGRHAAAGGLCRRMPGAVRGVLPGALRRPYHPGICRRLGAVRYLVFRLGKAGKATAKPTARTRVGGSIRRKRSLPPQGATGEPRHWVDTAPALYYNGHNFNTRRLALCSATSLTLA